MSTTVVPDYTKLPVVKTIDEVRPIIQDWLEMARGDEDKAGTVDDACFYEGFANAFESVLMLMTGQLPD